MSFPNVFVIGANHHKAPIEVREKLALASHNEDALLTHLRSIDGLHLRYLGKQKSLAKSKKRMRTRKPANLQGQS